MQFKQGYEQPDKSLCQLQTLSQAYVIEKNNGYLQSQYNFLNQRQILYPQVSLSVKMTDNTQRLQAIFNKANMNRNNIQYKLSRTLYDHVSFMEHKIRKQLKTFTLLSICGGQRASFAVNAYFQNAYNALTLEEKVLEFQKTIDYIRRFEEEKENNNVTTEDRQLEGIKNKYGPQVKISIDINTGFRSWEQETITISGFKIYSDKKINIDLRNYLLRKSKKKEVDCYVLEAIRSSKPQTIRFCFKRKEEEKQNFALINELINAAYYDFICKESFGFEPGIMKKSSKTGKTTISLEEPKKISSNRITKNTQAQQQNINFDMQDPAAQKHSVSVSYELMRSKDEQQLQQDLKDIIEKQNEYNQIQPYLSSKSLDSKSSKKIKNERKNFPNIFKIMLPSYNLNELDSLHNYEPVYNQNDQKLSIFRNRINRHKFKMELSLNVTAQNALMIIYNVEMYKIWHTTVSEGQLKFRISSQNCAIFYQKHSKFSQWYRERDFLYLKHVFMLQNNYYIIDKSFENTNFVPFSTIQRGKLHYCVTRIVPTDKGCSIMLETQIDHGGLLKQQYQQELTVNYLKGFKNIESYCSRPEFLNKLKVYFHHEWDIQETINNDSQLVSVQNLKTEDFDNSRIGNNSLDESELYFSVDDLDWEDQLKDIDAKSEHQLKEENIIEHEEHMKEIANLPAKIKVDEKGMVIVPKTHIKKKHFKSPLESNPTKRAEQKFSHVLLQDNWKPMQTGGLQIVNQKKIQAQNNVFGFILKKLRQNIFSGKGLTNISLPVQIFNCDSNLSRICRGFTLAPQFLETAAKSKDPIERMKLTMVFGVSSSLFFLDAEKPFNPILGQTYQGIIDGCPIYAEQISHHPPISCFYMIGRGYKIFGAIEAKVNLHLNSADGVNQGFYHVEYDDGQKISFTGPAGQVSNTTMGGNRQFNYLGKGCYYDIKNNLYSELKFQQETGMFSKGKWKFRDQVEAEIMKVKDSFMNQVVNKIKQNKGPASKQIQERYNKLSGRWLYEIKWDDTVYYKINEDLPFDMANYDHPLPSDVYFREDIYYRIMEDLARSQIQKERLEVLQRGDRKFREKYHGKSH